MKSLELANIGYQCEIFKNQTENFIAMFHDLDSYSIHFVFHLFHGVEIIGYKCPDEVVRDFCNTMYIEFCKTIHCNPETEGD